MTPVYDTFIQQFLRQDVINAKYVYIDYWSFVHFTSGIILGFIFGRFYAKKNAWVVVLGFLLLYEVIELFLIGILFVGESITDVIWDIIIGMTGFFVSFLIIKK